MNFEPNIVFMLIEQLLKQKITQKDSFLVKNQWIKEY